MRKYIYWPQILVLLTLNIFVVISWLIYSHFIANDSNFVFRISALTILSFSPLLGGFFYDNVLKTTSSKFVTVFVSFMCIAVLLLLMAFINFNYTFHIPVIVILLLWIFLINTLISVSNAHIENYVDFKVLPILTGVYSALVTLILAFKSDFVISMSTDAPGFFYMIFAVIGVIIGFLYYKINFKAHFKTIDEYPTRFASLKIIILGVILGGVVGCILFVVPMYSFAGLQLTYIFLVAAITAIPLGLFLQNQRLIFTVVVGTILFGMAMLNINHNNLFLNYVLLGVSLSCMCVSTFPIILKYARSNSKITHIGLFFSTTLLSIGLIQIFLTK